MLLTLLYHPKIKPGWHSQYNLAVQTKYPECINPLIEHDFV